MCKDSLIEKIEYGRMVSFSNEELQELSHLLDTNFYLYSKVHSISWITIENVTYKPSMVITVGYKDYLPIFSEIVDVSVNDRKQCVFLVKKIINNGWSPHICAFQVQLINSIFSINYEKLFNNYMCL